MDARFLLDPRGQLVPEDAPSGKALAGRSGRFLLAPTSPDLLCLVRAEPMGGVIPSPRVVLAGDAGAFPLSDFIAFLGQSRWSGLIRVHAPRGERTIHLKDGEVKAATSADPSERLGEIIVRLGFVTREALEEVLRETPPSKVGRILVERGLLQPHDLYKCLTEQVISIFHSIILCNEGAFFLVDQELEDKGVHHLSLSLHSLLMDAIRKVDEMAHFRKRIPHARMYVSRKRPSDGKLEPDEDRVLSLATGESTVAELGQQARLSEFDAIRAVYRLLEGGYAQISDRPVLGPRRPTDAEVAAVATGSPEARVVVPPRPAEPEPAPRQDARATVRVFNFIFREIRDEVAKQNMESEFISAANAALAGQALSSSPVLAGLAFDPQGNLPEEALLAQFAQVHGAMGSEPLASLRQALSDVMFFLLFQAGELLESRADEDLARRVKELLATIDAD